MSAAVVLILTCLVGLALGATVISLDQAHRRRAAARHAADLARLQTHRDNQEWAAIRAATEHSIDLAMWEQECDADS